MTDTAEERARQTLERTYCCLAEPGRSALIKGIAEALRSAEAEGRAAERQRAFKEIYEMAKKKADHYFVEIGGTAAETSIDLIRRSRGYEAAEIADAIAVLAKARGD